MTKSGTLDQPFQFSTKYYDQQTGLNYYGYRFYSPVLGRWINRDPLGEAGGVNLYGFVENNPVNRIDSFGLDPHTAKNPNQCAMCFSMCYQKYDKDIGDILSLGKISDEYCDFFSQDSAGCKAGNDLGGYVQCKQAEKHFNECVKNCKKNNCP